MSQQKVRTNQALRRQLLAAGFNAHHQLSAGLSEDVRAFNTLQLEPDSSAIAPDEVLFAAWSTTVVRVGSSIHALGFQTLSLTTRDHDVQLKCGFGNHDGLAGCVDQKGRLYLVEQGSMLLDCKSTDSSPKIGTIAAAGNGRVALTFKQAPNGNLCHVAEFRSIAVFAEWYNDPSGEGNYPENHHMLPGRPKQMLANNGTFIMLMENGEVHTWGDTRYQSLGRAVSGEDSIPADKPGIVDALGGVRISKIASGGWIHAALSTDAALYLWGSASPALGRRIHALQGDSSSQIALVLLPDPDSEPLDIVDVGVGNNHIVAVTDTGRAFAVGENKNGQLGLASDEDFFEDWQEVPDVFNVKTTWCGPKTSFVLAE